MSTEFVHHCDEFFTETELARFADKALVMKRLVRDAERINGQRSRNIAERVAGCAHREVDRLATRRASTFAEARRAAFTAKPTMSASGVVRSHTPEHHECVDLLLPERTKSKVAMSSTELEMPSQVRMTDKPVVLMQAPVELLAKQPVTCDDMSKRMKNLSTR